MSRDYRGERVVIYPSYLDKRLTRRHGRRVPLEVAVENPRLEEIYKAAVELGLDPVIEEGKRHPASWHQHAGRVIVKKIRPKNEILVIVAKSIREKYRRKH